MRAVSTAPNQDFPGNGIRRATQQSFGKKLGSRVLGWTVPLGCASNSHVSHRQCWNAGREACLAYRAVAEIANFVGGEAR